MRYRTKMRIAKTVYAISYFIMVVSFIGMLFCLTATIGLLKSREDMAMDAARWLIGFALTAGISWQLSEWTRRIRKRLQEVQYDFNLRVNLRKEQERSTRRGSGNITSW